MIELLFLGGVIFSGLYSVAKSWWQARGTSNAELLDGALEVVREKLPRDMAACVWLPPENKARTLLFGAAFVIGIVRGIICSVIAAGVLLLV